MDTKEAWNEFFRKNEETVDRWPIWKKQAGRMFVHSGCQPCAKNKPCIQCERFEAWLIESEKRRNATR